MLEWILICRTNDSNIKLWFPAALKKPHTCGVSDNFFRDKDGSNSHSERDGSARHNPQDMGREPSIQRGHTFLFPDRRKALHDTRVLH